MADNTPPAGSPSNALESITTPVANSLAANQQPLNTEVAAMTGIASVPTENTNNLRKLYDVFKSDYQTDYDYNTFAQKLNDESKLRALYDSMLADYELDSFDVFKAKLQPDIDKHSVINSALNAVKTSVALNSKEQAEGEQLKQIESSIIQDKKQQKDIPTPFGNIPLPGVEKDKDNPNWKQNLVASAQEDALNRLTQNVERASGVRGIVAGALPGIGGSLVQGMAQSATQNALLVYEARLQQQLDEAIRNGNKSEQTILNRQLQDFYTKNNIDPNVGIWRQLAANTETKAAASGLAPTDKDLSQRERISLYYEALKKQAEHLDSVYGFSKESWMGAIGVNESAAQSQAREKYNKLLTDIDLLANAQLPKTQCRDDQFFFHGMNRSNRFY